MAGQSGFDNAFLLIKDIWINCNQKTLQAGFEHGLRRKFTYSSLNHLMDMFVEKRKNLRVKIIWCKMKAVHMIITLAGYLLASHYKHHNSDRILIKLTILHQHSSYFLVKM